MKLCKKEQLFLKVKKAQISIDFAGYFSILVVFQEQEVLNKKMQQNDPSTVIRFRIYEHYKIQNLSSKYVKALFRLYLLQCLQHSY